MASSAAVRRKQPTRPIGEMIKEWRVRRRYSQLDLSLEASISQRHLSFLESGRSMPIRDMVLHLAERLEVPLRERNAMLISAGYAPIYLMRSLDDPSMAAARRAVDQLLERHAPFPAIAIDRLWNAVAMNGPATAVLAALIAPALLEPPLNVMRASLHPEGLAPHIANLPQWRAHLLERLRRQVAANADADLAGLLAEPEAMDGSCEQDVGVDGEGDVFVPMVLDTPLGRLSFLSTTTVFGTPHDVTLAEIAIESFFPADDATAKTLGWMNEHSAGSGRQPGMR
jgi:transcriptional regulator with XRE-family HTH domain